jgi:hypothetical protein
MTSGISATNNNCLSSFRSVFAQHNSDLQELAGALKTGDLSAAQKAFSQLQSDSRSLVGVFQSLAASNATSTAAAGTTTGTQAAAGASSTQSDPMAALAQALSSGDLAGAQQAFAALQQAMGQHHHGRPHGMGFAGATSSTTASIPGTGSSDGQINLTA